MHVHSWYSGRADLPVLGHVGRECYSDPEDVYEAATRRGVDLVTLTDHDGIEGALRLAHRPNTFVSEEVTVVLPGKRLLHVNTFDITRAELRGGLRPEDRRRQRRHHRPAAAREMEAAVVTRER